MERKKKIYDTIGTDKRSLMIRLEPMKEAQLYHWNWSKKLYNTTGTDKRSLMIQLAPMKEALLYLWNWSKKPYNTTGTDKRSPMVPMERKKKIYDTTGTDKRSLMIQLAPMKEALLYHWNWSKKPYNTTGTDKRSLMIQLEPMKEALLYHWNWSKKPYNTTRTYKRSFMIPLELVKEYQWYHCIVYRSTCTNISGNIIKHNLQTSMNERTHFFIKICISHTLFSKWLMLVVCERWAGEKDGLLFWPKVLLTISALLPHLGWVAQPWVTEDPKPSVCRWFSRGHLVSNWLKPSVCWLYYCLTYTCFRCSSAYLHRRISWLTARSRVNMLQLEPLKDYQWYHQNQ